MLRLMITATISLLISFGAISKIKKVSSLLNHMSQDHVAHSHDNHGNHHHHHSHKHSNNTKTDHNEHSHNFELSLLAQFFTNENSHTHTLIAPPVIDEALLPITHITLLFGRYSLSIFRPPIA